MLKICAFCNNASTDDEAITCAQCGAALPSPLPMPARSRRSGLGDGVGSGLLASPLGLLGLFILTMAGVWAVSGWMLRDPGSGKDDEHTRRIRVGMHVSQVGPFLNEKLPPQKYLELHY